MYCTTNDAPTFQVKLGGVEICHRCRVDLSTSEAARKHPKYRPIVHDYVADQAAETYQANLRALGSVSALWGYGIHGDDADGWVDLEFPDLARAAAFVQVLPEGVQAVTALRGPVAMFRGKRVVITFPIPDDFALFGPR